ncbi:rhomboid family intramembrane serine protease [Haloarculaceae archaeon H-GB2-1]|nr:rhomboid family intramembrane serine protease [Haloarculaceae archaeon H-GB1-1]MEA5388774.1 rhomboid family intramembrane serine protease [Haloarculaceae archaeon H-GB11]MEA5406830.1 rhomboid family intramembrane serine protease [Haloarculaceae archaeon H-GB2-1]
MARRPTVTLLVVFVVVYLLQRLAGVVGVPMAAFALAAPIAVQPWTLVTSVYAHGSLGHLLANAVTLVVVGVFLERRTSAVRFHLFFLGAGVLTGLAQVMVASLFGQHVAVLGASGAIFALLGYLLAGNRVTDAAVAGVSVRPRLRIALLVLLAAVVTLATAMPGVALVAHFTGLFVGLLAGRAHLLRP